MKRNNNKKKNFANYTNYNTERKKEKSGSTTYQPGYL
jgi:hypothetical protein